MPAGKAAQEQVSPTLAGSSQKPCWQRCPQVSMSCVFSPPSSPPPCPVLPGGCPNRPCFPQGCSHSPASHLEMPLFELPGPARAGLFVLLSEQTPARDTGLCSWHLVPSQVAPCPLPGAQGATAKPWLVHTACRSSRAGCGAFEEAAAEPQSQELPQCKQTLGLGLLCLAPGASLSPWGLHREQF